MRSEIKWRNLRAADTRGVHNLISNSLVVMLQIRAIWVYEYSLSLLCPVDLSPSSWGTRYIRRQGAVAFTMEISVRGNANPTQRLVLVQYFFSIRSSDETKRPVPRFKTDAESLRHIKSNVIPTWRSLRCLLPL